MAARLVKAPPEAVAGFEDVGEEMVPRNCKLRPYRKVKVAPQAVTGEFIAYASPDSTYAVTKQFFEAAKESILIGIYDFTAGYVKELLLRAMRRRVKVTLMLDLDNRPGENEIFDELVKYGCEGVAAPSCASKYAHYFASSHEKVIVIDGAWTLVQSGNYSDNSIPANESDGVLDAEHFFPGNRDMGVAIRSRGLAAFFTRILRADIRLELKAEAEEAVEVAVPTPEFEELLEEAPPEPPPLVASKRFKPPRPVKVTPVLSPDNYLDVMPAVLAAAKKSIAIEQQYIRPRQPLIRKLLAAIRQAVAKNRVEVRVILARPLGGGRRFEKEAEDIKALSEFGLRLGKEVRILNPKHFVHCHNKLVVVDDARVLVSSQNWSDSAVSLNREAGLLLESPELAKYYAGLFQTDWDTGLKSLVKRARFFAPESLATGKVVRLNWGDYAEV
jgi:phosphatidylserine/phosphatidylglycerophosphate/cardiolipin synthase-like enzyme